MKLRLLTLVSLSLTLVSFAPPPSMMGGDQSPKLLVNNRVLASIHEKSLSVVDVMKHMDILFMERFSDYATSTAARYQFYQANWRQALQELVDRELILCDARDIKLPVERNDIRQEMDRVFGPHVMVTLANLGLTYDEAWSRIEDDLMMRRMVYMRVNFQAMTEVTPAIIKGAYEEYVRNFQSSSECNYQVLSIRGGDETTIGVIAHAAHSIQESDHLDLPDLKKRLEQEGIPDGVTVSVSMDFHHLLDDISESYKTAISQLEPGAISEPISQRNRRDGSLVYRIFHLKEMEQKAPLCLEEAYRNIENGLMQQAMAKGTSDYIQRLRGRYNVSDEIASTTSENFQPFRLQ